MYKDVYRLPYSPNWNTTASSYDAMATGIRKAVVARLGRVVAKIYLVRVRICPWGVYYLALYVLVQFWLLGDRVLLCFSITLQIFSYFYAKYHKNWLNRLAMKALQTYLQNWMISLLYRYSTAGHKHPQSMWWRHIDNQNLISPTTKKFML